VTNLVANGNFEQDGSFKDLKACDVSKWARTITKNRGDVNKNGNGLQGNGGNCSEK